MIQGDLNLTNSGIKHTYSKIQNLFSKVSIKIDSDPEYSKLWEQMEQDSSTKIFEDLKSLNYRRFRKKNKMDDVEFGQFMCMSYLSISTTQQLIEANDRLKQLMSPNN